MSEVIVHRFVEQKVKNLKRNEYADCTKCALSERTKLMDGEEGLLCHAALYDIKTLACFIPKNN